MGYRTLKDCVDDLAARGQLVRIEQPVDPYLEAAEIQRRVFRAGGPAIYLARVKGCQFPMVGNLLGTLERARYILRDALAAIGRLIELKSDPSRFWRRPWYYRAALRAALSARVRWCRTGPVLANETTIDQLPQLVSWPDDGGAFVTLPQVYTEHPDYPGLRRANLGMYRVQLSGGQYTPNQEVGLHYQIHRGIGVHHAAAIRAGTALRVNVFIGGAPAMNLAAVMPLPEGLSELAFAGALARRRMAMIPRPDTLPLYAEADFCIAGTIDQHKRLPEGPFGDHLGYYSLVHDFPVLRVARVYHRTGAIWPFTVVGRPPQEDSVYGQLIHELTEPVIPVVLPGVHAVHAVDAAGVHPLLLAIGSERYTPYSSTTRPQELLTQANAILGQGQLSLAKYLLILAREDAPDLRIDNVAGVVQHVLERADWTRDLHFQTCTTIDTLDYSGSGLNEGSKLVIAAVGRARRVLPSEVPVGLVWPPGFKDPRVVLPGILTVAGPPCGADARANTAAIEAFCAAKRADDPLCAFPWVVVVDDSQFAAHTLANFLWVTFTRSNPAADVYGIEARVEQKHWGCRGSLVIDARRKPHHAPPLVEDPAVTRRVDALGARGGPLHGII
ncbi:MAG: 3-octaprenyl-4-hydroxybenzoate carboxy-lyase [Planctomycetes bacterium RBG_16_64_10]|nr:MAG: 3-octaprenyl-4-hydroxybenzoate carboxy-lyase [Planctomycetes bacterium RBG_16_64_10]